MNMKAFLWLRRRRSVKYGRGYRDPRGSQSCQMFTTCIHHDPHRLQHSHFHTSCKMTIIPWLYLGIGHRGCFSSRAGHLIDRSSLLCTWSPSWISHQTVSGPFGQHLCLDCSKTGQQPSRADEYRQRKMLPT